MKKIKQNRVLSFVIVTLVYILSAIVGITVYRALSFKWWLSLLIADAVATVSTFIFSVIFGNASVYDPYWSVQPAVILIAFALDEGINPYGMLILAVVLVWAVRLTVNWAYTFGGLTHQDWRYTMLKEKTKAFYPIINFVGIHMVPTLVVYGCVLPATYAIVNGLSFNLGSILFLLLSLCAVTMQGIADVQMHKYRKNKKEPFICVGLWKYSRHPNYLGEILMWWGVALSVWCADTSAFYLLSGALANTVLFFSVSIPLADKRQSRKDGFEEYKRRTRMLLPIKKKLR